MSDVSAIQDSWFERYEACGYTYAGISRISKMDAGQISAYIRCIKIPRQKNLEKMEKIMLGAEKLKRIPFHPSYGFATEEQIHKLKTLKKGVDLDQVFKEIEEQTRNGGKVS